MCVVEEKFAEKIKNVKKEKNIPQQIRGIDVASIDIEKTEKQKEILAEKTLKLRRAFFACLPLYFIFFGMLYYILNPLKKYITEFGKGIQLIFIVLITMLINKAIKSAIEKTKINDTYGISQMLLIFAFCCMVLAFIMINEFPENFLGLNR